MSIFNYTLGKTTPHSYDFVDRTWPGYHPSKPTGLPTDGTDKRPFRHTSGWKRTRYLSWRIKRWGWGFDRVVGPESFRGSDSTTWTRVSQASQTPFIDSTGIVTETTFGFPWHWYTVTISFSWRTSQFSGSHIRVETSTTNYTGTRPANRGQRTNILLLQLVLEVPGRRDTLRSSDTSGLRDHYTVLLESWKEYCPRSRRVRGGTGVHRSTVSCGYSHCCVQESLPP